MPTGSQVHPQGKYALPPGFVYNSFDCLQLGEDSWMVNWIIPVPTRSTTPRNNKQRVRGRVEKRPRGYKKGGKNQRHCDGGVSDLMALMSL
jgi:hypothetical protein